MKLLWINPSFLDYRIPLYKKINNILNGNFRLIYSANRVPKRCIDNINEAIGRNAIDFKNEKVISIGNNNLANKGIKIPITRGLYQLIKRTRPTIIISEGFFQFTPIAVLYALIHKTPIILTYERTAHTERQCPLWRKLYRRFIGLFIDGYIVNGTLTKDYLISQKANPNKIFTGAMCADSEGLAKKVLNISKSELLNIKEMIMGKTHNGLTYLFVGRIIESKGVSNLLDAWVKHIIRYPNDKLIVVGEGPLLEIYKSEYTHNSIIFIGGIDYSEIYKYYAISDVFVMPTLEDNWSLVVPEAMACGLPIACSIYNGCYPELIKEDFNGKIFNPSNNDDIVNTLSYFHHNNIEQMGIHSKEIEKEFSTENVANNILNAVNIIYNSKI